ncbi:MAG: hypothetical protein GY772_24135 [bacterium]|nr:hypothetical protein [bacterium]
MAKGRCLCIDLLTQPDSPFGDCARGPAVLDAEAWTSPWPRVCNPPQAPVVIDLLTQVSAELPGSGDAMEQATEPRRPCICGRRWKRGALSESRGLRAARGHAPCGQETCRPRSPVRAPSCGPEPPAQEAMASGAAPAAPPMPRAPRSPRRGRLAIPSAASRPCRWGRCRNCHRALRPGITLRGEPFLGCSGYNRKSFSLVTHTYRRLSEGDAMLAGFPARMLRRVTLGF